MRFALAPSVSLADSSTAQRGKWIGAPAPRRRGRAALAAATLAVLAAAALAADAPQPLARLNIAETQLTASQAHNLNQLAQLLTIIELLRRDPPPALLVSPADARGAARAAILVRAMTPELQARARAYAHEASEMMRQRRLAAVASEAMFTRDSALADALPPPAASPPAAVAPPVPRGGPRAAPRSLAAPVAGRLVRRFGEPAPGGGRANGLTWATARAARVVSPGAGLVQYVGPVKGWGTILILRLTGGYHLVLAGLGQVTVPVGQSVASGQPVGWMPDGRQSPSELYLEVRQQDAPVDPGRWLAG
jgi:septal ring factor EnvC (AmiA/AmiB activator)